MDRMRDGEVLATGNVHFPCPDARGVDPPRWPTAHWSAVTFARQSSCRMARHCHQGNPAMGESIKKKFDLGRSGTIVCHLSEDAKKMLIEFNVDKEGLSKTGVNGLIDALKKMRDKMVR
jgi:hypothetical protein